MLQQFEVAELMVELLGTLGALPSHDPLLPSYHPLLPSYLPVLPSYQLLLPSYLPLVGVEAARHAGRAAAAQPNPALTPP
jgi:hypothetical protein